MEDERTADEPDESADEGAIETRFLGTVVVDTGMLVIGDPGHLIADRGGEPGLDYAEARDADPQQHAVQVRGGLALLVQRFGGDGMFPVYGEFVNNELMAVRVDFVDPTEEWE